VQSSLPRVDLTDRFRGFASATVLRVHPATAAYLVPAVAALLATQTWFRAGTFVATGDVPPFIRTNLMAEVSSVWGHSIAGAGSASFQPTARAPELAILALTRALGWDPATGQRLFYSAIAVAVVVGAVWFARTFVERPVPAIVAGLVAFFNPFVLQHLPNPLPLWSIGLMAFSGGLLLRAARGDDVPGWKLGAVSVGACYLSINPPLLAASAAWVLLVMLASTSVCGPGGSARAVRAVVGALPWALLLNLWWLFPLVVTLATQGTGYRVEAETDVLAWSWTHARLSIPNILSLDGHWAWSHPEYFPFADRIDRSIWSALRFGLPVVALMAPLVGARTHRRPALVMAGGILALSLLAKGLHPPFGGANLFLYRYVPGMWLLREPMSKLGPMLVLLSSALVAVSLSGIAGRLSRSTSRPAVTAPVAASVLVAAAIVFNFPMFTGAVVPDDRPQLPSAHVSVPEAWHRVAEALNTEPVTGKVLVLPLDDFYQMPTTWGYYGVDQIPRSLLTRPTIQPLPGSYYGGTATFVAAVRQVETALLSDDLAVIHPLLRSLGVSDVIVRRDLRDDMAGRSIARGAELSRRLATVRGMSPRTSFGVADVFRVEEPDGSTGPLVRTVAAWDASGVPEGLMPLTAGSLPATAAASSGTGTASRVSILGATDEALSFDSDGGPVRIVPRRIGPQIVHLSSSRGVDGRVVLIATPAAGIVLDGLPLDRGQPSELDLGPIGDVAAVRTPEGLIAMREGAQVGLAHSAAVTAYTREATSLPLTGRLTDVHDCKASDGRTLGELAISAVPVPAQGAGAVELQARAHTACVRLGIEALGGKGPLLIELDHRTLAGEPARVCVWESGPDRCAPIPSLSQAPGWHRFVVALRPSPGTRRLQLFLYADGSWMREPTRVQYRRVQVTALQAAATGVLDVPSPPSAALEAGPGTHELRTTLDAAAELTPISSSVKDCNAYDDKTTWQAGLRMTPLGTRRSPGVRLRAWAHSACVSASLTGFVPGGRYVLEMEARAVRGSPARFCLWEAGSGACAILPRIERASEWTRYRAQVAPQRGTIGLRLFLYADGSKPGDGDTVAKYRAIRVTPFAPFAVAVVDPGPGRVAPPAMSWTRTGSSSFRVDVARAKGPFVLSLAESTAKGWSLADLPPGRSATPVVVDGYAQGWLISAGQAFSTEISYTPDRWFRVAALSSGAGALLLPMVAFGRRRRSVLRSRGGAAW
jgi:arabinofuranan 3-O-arabinosyltransferase